MKFVISIVGFCCCLSVFGQQKTSMLGRVVDERSGLPIRYASILLVVEGKTVLSNSQGEFLILVNKGQLFALSATGYYTDTVRVNDSLLNIRKPLFILRSLPDQLPNVVVTSNLNRYQIDSLLRRNDFMKLVGKSDIPAVGRANDLGFGVALNLDHFSKGQKSKRRAKSLFELLETEAYINYRWNETFVNRYTGLTDDALADFMNTNRPNWFWLRKFTEEEDLVLWINKALKNNRLSSKQ